MARAPFVALLFGSLARFAGLRNLLALGPRARLRGAWHWACDTTGGFARNTTAGFETRWMVLGEPPRAPRVVPPDVFVMVRGAQRPFEITPAQLLCHARRG